MNGVWSECSRKNASDRNVIDTCVWGLFFWDLGNVLDWVHGNVIFVLAFYPKITQRQHYSQKLKPLKPATILASNYIGPFVAWSLSLKTLSVCIQTAVLLIFATMETIYATHIIYLQLKISPYVDIGIYFSSTVECDRRKWHMCCCNVDFKLCIPCDSLIVAIADPYPAELLQAIIFHLLLELTSTTYHWGYLPSYNTVEIWCVLFAWKHSSV